jgi:hypothetical protein
VSKIFSACYSLSRPKKKPQENQSENKMWEKGVGLCQRTPCPFLNSDERGYLGHLDAEQ